MATRAAETIFPAVVDAICRVHDQCAAQAKRSLGFSLTLRNWVIGAYILEYGNMEPISRKTGGPLLGRRV